MGKSRKVFLTGAAVIAAGPTYEDVDCSEIKPGAVVRIVALGWDDYQAFVKYVTGGKGKIEDLLAWCAVSSKFEKVFSVEEARSLGGSNRLIYERLLTVAYRLNGLSEPEAEDVKGN